MPTAKVANTLACDIVIWALGFVVPKLVTTVAFNCYVGGGCKITGLLERQVLIIVLNYNFVIRLGVLFANFLLRVLGTSKPCIWRDYVRLTARKPRDVIVLWIFRVQNFRVRIIVLAIVDGEIRALVVLICAVCGVFVTC